MPFSTKQKFAEFFHISFEDSKDGHWLGLLDEPLSVSLPLEEQAEHLFKYAYLAECNLAFARMYGYSNPKDLVGTRFPQLLLLSDPANLNAVRSFLLSRYKIENVETHERAKSGEEKYFLNDVYGVVKENFLVHVWGRQRDITSFRLHQLSFNHLTPRELSVLKLTIEGKTLKEIGQIHNISGKAVDRIRTALKRKFDAKTIPELTARVVRLGLFDFGGLSGSEQLGLFASPPSVWREQE